MRSLGIIFALSILSGCGADKPSQHELEMALRQQEPRFLTKIGKIEKLRTESGQYPSDLPIAIDQTFSAAELPPKFKNLRTTHVRYEVARDRSFFRVTYELSDSEDYELYASSSYLSIEKKWEINRHVQRFSQVEAQYFGAQYKQSHSSKYLSLAISSLLDAAKSSNAYPCRNLWAEWLEKAIGTGENQPPVLPAMPVLGETKIYATKDNKVTFGVVVDRKIFGPMKTPLPFVIGVYEFSKQKTAWVLVQQCDSSA